MFFVQTSTQPPNMHLKLTKHGKFCNQNNQLPTKSRDELEDNSNIRNVLVTSLLVLANDLNGKIMWVLGDFVRTLITKYGKIINRLLRMLNLFKQQLDEWCKYIESYHDH